MFNPFRPKQPGTSVVKGEPAEAEDQNDGNEQIKKDMRSFFEMNKEPLVFINTLAVPVTENANRLSDIMAEGRALGMAIAEGGYAEQIGYRREVTDCVMYWKDGKPILVTDRTKPGPNEFKEKIITFYPPERLLTSI